MRLSAFVIVLICVLIIPGHARALQFTPTDAEWAAWPEYCRARYVVSGSGKGSKFRNRVSPSEVEEWNRRLRGSWYGLHHYCAGLAFLNKAKRTWSDPQKRKQLYNEAIHQADYNIRNTEPEDPMFPKMIATQAQALAGLGQYEDALKSLQQVRELHPTNTDVYAVTAVIYRKQGQLDKAKEILIEGNAAVEGKSAEIHYMLGLILVELQEFAAAAEHAKQAYELGYPLPGLKNKLKKSGYWVD